jgi:phospholipid/cholesterol/gamma-HCH transport system ATP-binding protein
LRKRVGGTDVLAGVDLAIPEGSLAVVLGPPGSGKSLLLKALVGLLEPDSGDVLVRGRPLGRMSRSEVLALRREIGVMFQEGGLFSSLTVFENVAFPLRQHTNLNEAEIWELVDAQLAAVGLAESAARMPLDLSAAMKKRASLARALVLEPGIVVCDEPDRGLDGIRSTLMVRVLAERHSRVGGTMVIATRDGDLARLGDHVSVLWDGRVLVSGTPEAVFDCDDPLVQRALAGDKVPDA